MSPFVVRLEALDRTTSALAGGKGANLGELGRVGGIRVPDGFCVTTEAFARVAGAHEELRALIDSVDDGSGVAARIRALIEGMPIPSDLAAEIRGFLSESQPYAVRSSATAEDLPGASFAGQQDTYLNVIGSGEVLRHISKCWASLFTDRAVIYRRRNGFDHRRVQLAVVVQKMIFPRVAGILFTADPVSGHRKVSSIDASFGLGEALVSGVVNADHYKVRGGQVFEKKIATKKLAIVGIAGGGTQQEELGSSLRDQRALTDAELVELERIGRKIEAHFGAPQDIEWCLADDGFYVVQSRPITTLFPVPHAGDSEDHVYISVGHQQMMTDPMKPLGWSFFQLTAGRPMYQAGGRLFVDITAALAAPASKKALVDGMGQHDPLLKDALLKLLERTGPVEPPTPPILRTPGEIDPAIVGELIRRSEASVAATKLAIRAQTGVALFDFIRADIAEHRKVLFDAKNMGAIMAGIDAATWINTKMEEWLGPREKNAADSLSQSLANNVTSEMGLALLEVADVIRPHPEVITFLQGVTGDDFLNHLDSLVGGRESRAAIEAYLAKYGMRCAGEIDITRPRWSEKPRTLVPIILGNVKNFEPGAGKRKFEQGLREVQAKEEELLRRLSELPDGATKIAETKRMIGLIRNFAGYREYPKYSIVSRYLVYKEALREEARRLVGAGVIRAEDDIYELTFDELRESVSAGRVEAELFRRRKEDHEHNARLTPPRLITSDGEIVVGTYERGDLPAGAMPGLAVSAGVAEGKARVIATLEEAVDLGPEDILVTAFTDPSWTPLFVSIRGLVTEVGGLMTHGAVIAREYGLPAVVGVERATKLIRDGQRIRVNGSEGYVELLG